MIKTTAILLEELQQYKAPENKLARMVKKGTIFPIVKGLYETVADTPGHLLAGAIYGPSYLSFDFALGHYQLIPEAVYTITSATFLKKKKKQFETRFGIFSYCDVPPMAYPEGILIRSEGEYHYQIADPEKALCDKLYILPPVTSVKALEEMLFEDLRIDPDVFAEMDFAKLTQYAPLYRTTKHKLLLKLIRRI